MTVTKLSTPVNVSTKELPPSGEVTFAAHFTLAGWSGEMQRAIVYAKQTGHVQISCLAFYIKQNQVAPAL